MRRCEPVSLLLQRLRERMPHTESTARLWRISEPGFFLPWPFHSAFVTYATAHGCPRRSGPSPPAFAPVPRTSSRALGPRPGSIGTGQTSARRTNCYLILGSHKRRANPRRPQSQTVKRTMKVRRPSPFVLWSLIGAAIGTTFTLIADWDQGALHFWVILLSALIGGVWGTSLAKREDD